jgi:hypothetical protein
MIKIFVQVLFVKSYMFRYLIVLYFLQVIEIILSELDIGVTAVTAVTHGHGHGRESPP